MMFMASFAVLLAVVWLLERLRAVPRPLSEALAVDAPAGAIPATAAVAGNAARASPVPAAAAAALLVATAVTTALLPARTESAPPRTPLLEFPLAFAQWHGEAQSIDATYLQALKLSDYLLADYLETAAGARVPAVNLYVAWYDSQRQGQAAHSPRSCLPGDGWEIDALTTVDLAPGVAVNRALIRKGDDAQLVYYWFAQRGRTLTSEYAVKWWLLVDAVLRNRTDGALVRLTTPLAAGEAPADADARLRAFAADALARLDPHLPR
jgi:EpsI family protein